MFERSDSRAARVRRRVEKQTMDALMRIPCDEIGCCDASCADGHAKQLASSAALSVAAPCQAASGLHLLREYRAECPTDAEADAGFVSASEVEFASTQPGC